MADLNLDLDFPDHPKTLRLIAIAGQAAGFALLRLWCYAGRVRPRDGSFRGYDDAEIEAHADWKGKPGALIGALRKVHFLDGKTLHNWPKRQGHLWALKEQARAAAQARWRKWREKSVAVQEEASMRQHCGGMCASNAWGNAPDHPDHPDHTRPPSGEYGYPDARASSPQPAPVGAPQTRALPIPDSTLPDPISVPTAAGSGGNGQLPAAHAPDGLAPDSDPILAGYCAEWIKYHPIHADSLPWLRRHLRVLVSGSIPSDLVLPELRKHEKPWEAKAAIQVELGWQFKAARYEAEEKAKAAASDVAKHFAKGRTS